MLSIWTTKKFCRLVGFNSLSTDHVQVEGKESRSQDYKTSLYSLILIYTALNGLFDYWGFNGFFFSLFQ